MTIAAQTTLGQVLELDRARAMDVLARFGIIHCAHCEVDESQTLSSACAEHKVPEKLVINALAAALKG